jgi:hypothetical protein
MSLLLYGAATKHISTEAFRRLLDAVLGDGVDGATEAALGLLQQRLDIHPEEEETLEAQAWQTIERKPIRFLDPLTNHVWVELAGRYSSRDPLRISRAILDRVEAENTFFQPTDPVMKVLVATTRICPQAVWEEVALRLLTDRPTSVALHQSLRGWYAEHIPIAIMLQWAEQHLPKGPRLLATLTPVGEQPLNDLARQLLVRFGDDKQVGGSLQANLLAGTYWGPTSTNLQSKRDAAHEWLEDSEPAVRSWACSLVEALDRWSAVERVREEEGLGIR